MLLALADGLGGTRNAHVASELAATAALDRLESRTAEALVDWPEAARQVFEEVAHLLQPHAVDGIARRQGVAPTKDAAKES